MIWADNMWCPTSHDPPGQRGGLDQLLLRARVAAKLAAYVWRHICPVKGAQEEMEKIRPELVDNELIFPRRGVAGHDPLVHGPRGIPGPRLRRRFPPMSLAADHPARTLRLTALTKFANFTAVRAPRPEVPAGTFFAPAQAPPGAADHHPRMVARLETPDLRLHPPRRGRHHLGEAVPPPGQHRLPELRALPAPRHPRERRLSAAPAQGQGRRPAGARCPELVEPEAQAKKKPPQMSGGQQQRVALARALINRLRCCCSTSRWGAGPQAAPRHADRDQADPDRGRPHLRARHARPGGGDDDGRHDRGHERRRHRADGLPTELYENPRTTFVANSRPVQPDPGDRDGRGQRRRTRRHARHAGLHPRRAGARARATGWIGIRPRRCSPRGRADRRPGNHLPGGVITDVSFVGVSTQYLVRMPWGRS